MKHVASLAQDDHYLHKNKQNCLGGLSRLSFLAIKMS